MSSNKQQQSREVDVSVLAALENGPRDVKGIVDSLTIGKRDVNTTLHALVDKEFVRKEGQVFQLLEKGRGRLTWLRENP